MILSNIGTLDVYVLFLLSKSIARLKRLADFGVMPIGSALNILRLSGEYDWKEAILLP